MGTNGFALRYLHIAALSIVGTLLAIMALFATTARATTDTFGYTGGEQTFVVPSGVTQLHVVLVGGHGGEGDLAGGVAAEVTADLNVTPGQTLYVEVGGIGEDSGDGGEGGFNGGAAGGSAAGGGGGASDIRLLPLSSGLIPDTRLIVAGGAGGGGGNGEDSGGAGGDAGSAGEFSASWEGGGAGTESAGGEGGEGCTGFGGNGQLGLGGGGGFGESGNNGGGGGYYGGGGGGGGCLSGGGGGGGGSSLLPAGAKLELASALAQPKVAITYTLPSGSPINPPSGDPTVVPPPGTVLGFHPPRKVNTAKGKAKVKFTFSATVAGATFRCKIDKGAYAPCTSPKKFKVKVGKHKFSVAAVKNGVVDPTPATFKFKVVKVPLKAR